MFVADRNNIKIIQAIANRSLIVQDPIADYFYIVLRKYFQGHQKTSKSIDLYKHICFIVF